MTATNKNTRELAVQFDELERIKNPSDKFARLRQLTIDFAGESSVWRVFSNFLISQSRYAEAIVQFKRALILEPQDLRSLRRMAAFYMGQERWHQALICYQAVIALSPGNKIALARAGRCQFKLGAVEASLATFKTLFGFISDVPNGDLVRKRLEDADIVFIHLPKTGGTSVESAITQRRIPSIHHRIILEGDDDRNDPYYTPSVPSMLSIDRYKDIKFFTNIRNIYSFLVSHYEWSRDAQWFLPQQFENNVAGDMSFEDYVYLLAERDGPWPSRHFLNIHLFSQPSGSFRMGWINRMEHLGQDMADMTTAWGLPAIAIGHDNANTKGDYRSRYSDKLVDFVRKTWDDDIRLFGFTFDGYAEEGGLFGDVTEYQSKLLYSADTKTVQIKEDANSDWQDF